jgi:hypothetical protein
VGFSDTQLKLLAGKLNEKHVRTREERGHTLSYVEGWHVIDEANRVFGFDGWDRETVWADCVWSDGRSSPRAGDAVICRDGSGTGHGTGASLGEAHESALKKVETDAIDKAELMLGAPRRHRDEDHRRFVASLPCLICGRSPTQAHHLRFAQPRSMGTKVSDEFTVPLCALHPRAIHDDGPEEMWWQAHGIRAAQGGGAALARKPRGERGAARVGPHHSSDRPVSRATPPGFRAFSSSRPTSLDAIMKVPLSSRSFATQHQAKERIIP